MRLSLRTFEALPFRLGPRPLFFLGLCEGRAAAFLFGAFALFLTLAMILTNNG